MFNRLSTILRHERLLTPGWNRGYRGMSDLMDLRPVICDAAIRRGGQLERETQVVVKNLGNARPLDYLKALPTATVT